ncbi:MAG: HNH/ENDO VII family nuclease [Firmicutes bacterium]|nr:HNH/ENDO VII family nuclease [Bacillota bacterium]
MKTRRLLALLLCWIMFFSGCTGKGENADISNIESIGTTNEIVDNSSEYSENQVYNIDTPVYDTNSVEYIESLGFTSLSDEDLQKYVSDTIYYDLVSRLDSDEYFVENVETVYYTKEYLEELAYNSKENIYFGYTLSELDKQFQGTKYIFTLGENGQTIVKPFEEYDDTFDQVVRNVAVGSGVILICVTVSAVSAGAGAPAISMVFAASAKSATTFALSSGVISSVSAGIVEGIETQDLNKALKAAALKGSEGYMWGAVAGSVTGGVSEGVALKGATLNGLTMNEAAMIQHESKYPLDLIKQFKSIEEYDVYRKAGLSTQMINGKTALLPNIDLEFKSTLPNGEEVTNLQRMLNGYAPLDPATGKAYQLHHIGQKADGTLAVLTESQHQWNSAILNTIGKESEIDRAAFSKIRKEFWKEAGKIFQLGLK